VINLMLAGTLRRCIQDAPLRARDAVSWLLDDGTSLRLSDPTSMAKAYLCLDPEAIPGFNPSPEPLDPNFTVAAFAQRLRFYRGEIKGVLTRGMLVAGIGNAYADEILFRAGIYPFRKAPSLSPVEIQRLYDAMRKALTKALAEARARLGDDLEIGHDRVLAIHNRGGDPCPVCGTPISEIRARGRMLASRRLCSYNLLDRAPGLVAFLGALVLSPGHGPFSISPGGGVSMPTPYQVPSAPYRSANTFQRAPFD